MTKASTHSEMDYISRIARLFHPEKKYHFLKGAHSPAAQAAMQGLPVDTFLAMKQAFLAQAQQAARDLVGDVSVRAAIASWPLAPGARIAVIGDSLTDDYGSWFDIVSHACTLVRPQDDLQFINTAVSGDTSAQMLGSVVRAVDMAPDVLLCLIGTNDARVQGAPGAKQCTSLDEVAKNLAAIADYAACHSAAKWLWMTPSGVDEARIESDWILAKFKARWSNQAIDAIADVIVARGEHCLDLRAAFRTGAIDPFSEDGLHWSPAGHALVARLAIAFLTVHLGAGAAPTVNPDAPEGWP